MAKARPSKPAPKGKKQAFQAWSIIIPAVYGVAACALAGWLTKVVLGEDPFPAVALVATIMVFAAWGGGIWLRWEGSAFSGLSATASQGVCLLLLGALGIHLCASIPPPVPTQDPLDKALMGAADRLTGGRPLPPAQGVRLSEAMDSARHFVHAYLANDRDHMKAFAIWDLQDEIDKIKLPAPLIKDAAAVTLDAIKVNKHQIEGDRMRVEVEYGTFKKEICMVRDVAWLVEKLP